MITELPYFLSLQQQYALLFSEKKPNVIHFLSGNNKSVYNSNIKNNT